VIVDATCRSRRDRALLLDSLKAAGVTLLIVRCEAPLALALKRAARRLGDPQRVSDATPQIAEAQFRAFEEFDEHSEGSVLRLDTAQRLDGQVADIARALDARGLRYRASRRHGAAPRNP
jgi:predicted kinase